MRADVRLAEKEKTCEYRHKAAERHNDTGGLRCEVGGGEVGMRVETQQHWTKTLKAAHAHVSMGRRHVTDKHRVGRGASHGAAAILSQLRDVTDERER